MQGLRGSTGFCSRSSRVLPEIQDRPLSEVPSLVRDNRPPSTAQSNEIHDVFISHASEDKDDFVRSLANSLISHGLNVWYDEMTLRIGDSLRQKIDKGLANSRVGLVVLSPAFISKVGQIMNLMESSLVLFLVSKYCFPYGIILQNKKLSILVHH
jgi:hypothetical protein